jgi:transcriptional regulator with XRE-family HTH domain/tetratricopeptide (TPR) repeat protein
MPIPNEQLETARIRKRWSVTVASEKVGVSVNTFNRWERGLQVPQLSTLDLACNAFDMSPEDLGFSHAIIAKRRTHHQRKDAKDEPVSTSAYPSTPLTPPVEGTHNFITTFPHSLCKPSGELSGQNLLHVGQTDHEEDGREEDMANRELSRRRVITTLIGTPITILGLTQGGFSKLLHPEEIVSLCEVSIPLLWRLYFEGGLDEVNQNLPGYLTQLTQLTQKPSLYQKKAANLASQGYQLASLLASQYQNFGTAATYAIQALTFADQVADPHLQAASLIRQALVYFYLRRPQQRLRAYERALHYSQKASALLQGRAHIGLSETYSCLRHEREASQHLKHAERTFPERCEEDIAFPYTHFNGSSLLGLEGIMHLNLGHPRQAWENFARMDKELPKTLVPNRLELTIRQAMATYQLGDRDQSCDYVKTAARSALMTGNHLRYDEAYDIYERLLQKWRKEDKVKELGALFLNI